MPDARQPMDVDRIETPERVELSADLAGIGSRGLALILDSLLLLVAALLLLVALIPVIVVERTTGVVIGIIAMFVLQWLYFALFEGLRDGQTPGKKAMGLRVRKVGGFPIGWPEALIRNFLRVVDGFGFYAVGMALLLVTSRSQRLGDLAAGTVVVRERDWGAGGLARIGYGHAVAAPRPAGGPAAPTTWLGAEEIETIQEFLERRGTLAPGARNRIAMELAELVKRRLLGRGAIDGALLILAEEAFLEAVLRGPAAPAVQGGTPAQPEDRGGIPA